MEKCLAQEHNTGYNQGLFDLSKLSTLSLQSHQGFLQFWEGPPGPRAFQIGKISVVNPLIGKFVREHNYGIFSQLKKQISYYTYYIAIKLKEK